MKSRLCILIMVLLSCPHLGKSDTAILSPSADAELQEAAPSGNFGTGDRMVSGKLGPTANGVIRHALLRFDLSEIPAQAQVTSATLQVSVIQIPGSPTDSTFDLRRILQDWSEASVSWDNRLSPSTPWSAPGATGTNDSVATASSSVPVSGVAEYIFSSTAGLISDVQRWITNAGSDFGWLLISQDEINFQTARHFGTRENAGAAPVLTINYTIPSTPANPSTISNITKTNSQIRFIFNAESNRTYTVESRASFSVTNWTALTNFAAAPTPTNRVVTDALAGTNKFYRVKTP